MILKHTWMRDSNTQEQKDTITNPTQSEPEIKDITGRSLTANSKPYCTQVPYNDFHHTEDLLQQKIQRLSIQLALVTSPTVQYLHSGGGQTNPSYRIVQNLIHTNKTRESRIRSVDTSVSTSSLWYSAFATCYLQGKRSLTRIFLYSSLITACEPVY